MTHYNNKPDSVNFEINYQHRKQILDLLDRAMQANEEWEEKFNLVTAECKKLKEENKQLKEKLRSIQDAISKI